MYYGPHTFMEVLRRSRIRFGVFEVDPRARELRKQGFNVKLQEQPFQILLMLLERPGEVVTREEIRKRLWPADTFVDFDSGLNRATNRLRESLGDDAENLLTRFPAHDFKLRAQKEADTGCTPFDKVNRRQTDANSGAAISMFVMLYFSDTSPELLIQSIDEDNEVWGSEVWDTANGRLGVVRSLRRILMTS